MGDAFIRQPMNSCRVLRRVIGVVLGGLCLLPAAESMSATAAATAPVKTTPAPAGVTPLMVAAGPWMTIDARGVVAVTVRLVPGLVQAQVRSVHPYIAGKPLPVEPVIRVVPAEGGALAGEMVATWTLPILTSGALRLGADPHAVAMQVPVPPGSHDEVRLVIAGGQVWPSKEQIEVAGKSVGGPISLVVALGTVATTRLGTGGWEDSIPLITRLGPTRTEPVAAAILGPTPLPGADFSWGLLGLPSTERGPEAAIDCVARPRPWNVLLDPLDTWDVGLLAGAERSDVQRLRVMVGVAKVLSVPLILTGGSASGFVSEPLSTAERGGLLIAAGGVRYISATPAGDGVRSLDPHLALSIDDAGLVALQATAEQVSLRAPGNVSLDWQHDSDVPSSGWGRGKAVELAEVWRTTAKLDPVLPWLPRTELKEAEWSLLELFKLATPEAPAVPTPDERALARRLVADPWFVGDEPVLLGRLPIWLRREAILRWLAEPDSGASAWTTIAADTEDLLLVRAYLASVEQGSSPYLLDVLVKRLTSQAAGRIPVDDDPVLQSRLTSAVFDSGLLSPTPLRAIARDLEGKLSTLGRKPIDRFFERFGRFRPATP